MGTRQPGEVFNLPHSPQLPARMAIAAANPKNPRLKRLLFEHEDQTWATTNSSRFAEVYFRAVRLPPVLPGSPAFLLNQGPTGANRFRAHFLACQPMQQLLCLPR